MDAALAARVLEKVAKPVKRKNESLSAFRDRTERSQETADALAGKARFLPTHMQQRRAPEGPFVGPQFLPPAKPASSGLLDPKVMSAISGTKAGRAQIATAGKDQAAYKKRSAEQAAYAEGAKKHQAGAAAQKAWDLKNPYKATQRKAEAWQQRQQRPEQGGAPAATMQSLAKPDAGPMQGSRSAGLGAQGVGLRKGLPKAPTVAGAFNPPKGAVMSMANPSNPNKGGYGDAKGNFIPKPAVKPPVNQMAAQRPQPAAKPRASIKAPAGGAPGLPQVNLGQRKQTPFVAKPRVKSPNWKAAKGAVRGTVNPIMQGAASLIPRQRVSKPLVGTPG